jgi:hypothetical protein
MSFMFLIRRVLIFIIALGFSFSVFSQQNNVERWRIFELRLKGPQDGNPYTDINLYAEFEHEGKKVSADGFYDGGGNFIVRFMPTEEGKWTYRTHSATAALNGNEGSFTCTPARKNNHGPVKVNETYHFAYADNTAYLPFGTTSYAWIHQGDSLARVTLKTLAGGYFNKMRMCIFPKWYDYNHVEPKLYPFEGKAPDAWDYTRFNPAYFKNIENYIAALDSLGIEADLIVFHPYDKWGFQKMGSANDDRYVRYVIARLAAYKNVWWSMANEYDLMEHKSTADWNRIIGLFAANDPYRKLLSIHQAAVLFDHSRASITHVSLQNEDTHRAGELRSRYHKPVIYDECRYEGNLRIPWGNITGEEMVNKFWRGITRGAYVGHGETYTTEKPLRTSSGSADLLWWSRGGTLRGKSHTRIKFMRGICESAPGPLEPAAILKPKEVPYGAVGFKDEYFLLYFNLDQPRGAELSLPDHNYTIDIIDTWNMTIKRAEGRFSGTSLLELPQKPGILLRIERIK